MSTAALPQIETYWSAVHAGDPVVELRVKTATGILAGYYDNPTDFGKAVQAVPNGTQFWSPLHQIDPVHIHGLNQLPARGATVGDRHIARYRWLLAEIDPERPKEVAATAEEKQHAHAVARKVFEHFKSLGISPVVIDSGNGFYVKAPIDLENTEENRLLFEQAMEGLSAMFSTPEAKLDTTGKNASRILGVPGTINIKGENTPERPHRMRKLLCSGSREVLLSREQLVEIAKRAPIEVIPPERAAKEVRGTGIFAPNLGPKWVEDWLANHSVGHRPRTDYQGGSRWILEECPFKDRHSVEDRDGHVAIIQKADGKLGFVCQHSHCIKTTWSEFRTAIEGETAPVVVSDPSSVPLTPIEDELSIQDAFPGTRAIGPCLKNGLPPMIGVEEDRKEVAETRALIALPSDGSDFIDQYAHCSDRFESPIQMHELIAISTLAALANKNGVTFEYCARQLPMDLWMTALMSSGGGKNESLRVMRELASSVRSSQNPFSATNWGSPEYFYEDFSNSPCKFLAFTETEGLFGRLSQPRWSSVKPWMTDLFDSAHVPPPIRHRTNNKGEANTPDIVFSAAPRLNILAMSSMDWYLDQLKSTDARGGFLARFLPVVLPDSSRLVHFVAQPEEETWQQLTAKFVRISQLSGPADISDIYSESADCVYAKWYVETASRWRTKGTVAQIFFKRWRVFALKLAVVFEMSDSESLKVTRKSFERAAKWLQKLEAIVFKLAEDEFSGDALRLHRKEKFFRAAGALGIMPSKYTARYRGEKPQRRKEDLATLLESRAILKVAARIGPKGENIPESYVHADFVKGGAQ